MKELYINYQRWRLEEKKNIRNQKTIESIILRDGQP